MHGWIFLIFVLLSLTWNFSWWKSHCHHLKLRFFVGSRRTWLKHGVLPTKNLPEKSHPRKPVKSRRTLFKHDYPSLDEQIDKPHSYSFSDHKDEAVAKLPEPWVLVESNESVICLVKRSKEYSIDEVKFIINSDLSCAAFLFGIPLPSTCLSQIDLLHESLVHELDQLDCLQLCAGFDTVLKSNNWVAITMFKLCRPVSSLADASTFIR